MILDQINLEIKSIEKEVLKWQRYFHMNPELGFKEVKTSQYIYDTLNSFEGIEVSRPTKTGIIGVVKGKNHGKTIAIRADIDALPIQEQNEGEYISKIPNMMHACGHDGHIAILLGTAKILAKMKEHISGEIRFLFQPAEEVLPGGAVEMVEAGVLENVDLILGFHLDAFAKSGTFGIKAGPIMASTHNFEIEIIGTGGHAAFPHLTADTVYTTGQLIVALQGILSRNISPMDSAVITTTMLEGSNSNNIIPKTVKLGGTIRILDQKCEKEIFSRFNDIINSICTMNKVDYIIKLNKGHNSLYNDDDLTNKVYNSLVKIAGKENVYEDQPVMGGEDFSTYLQYVKGCYYKIGGRKEKEGKVYPHHNPQFEINDDSYIPGINANIRIILDLMTMK